MTPFALSGLLAGISSLTFGLFVWIKTDNESLGERWLLFSIAVAVYGFGCLWIGRSLPAGEALLAWRLTYGLGVIWIPALFYHFVCVFIDVQRPRTILMQYAIAVLFVSLLPTGLFFGRLNWVFNSFNYALGGWVYLPYFVWWLSLVIFSHYELVRSYHRLSEQKRNQIKYFMLSTVVGFGGGTVCYLPNFGINIYPWGNFTVWLYPIIMAYAILKHRLMDIIVVVRKTLVYSFVTAVLASLYAGAITLMARLVENQANAPALSLSLTFPHSFIQSEVKSLPLILGPFVVV